MTLSKFLRDYLYIPLGGSRRGGARRYVNLSITMLLGGLWHGASWTFVMWGGLHGAFLAINHLWRRAGLQLPGPIAWAITFGAVMIGSVSTHIRFLVTIPLAFVTEVWVDSRLRHFVQDAFDTRDPVAPGRIGYERPRAPRPAEGRLTVRPARRILVFGSSSSRVGDFEHIEDDGTVRSPAACR